MSTTHTTTTTQLGKPLHRVAACQIALGNLVMISGNLRFVTGLELAEDSSITIRWDGGCTMCEADATFQVL